MNDFGRRILPDNDPLLRTQSLLTQQQHLHSRHNQVTHSTDDGDSQSVDYTDDNLIQYDLEDNFHGIESNFEDSNMINESENIVDIDDSYKLQNPHQKHNIASRLSTNNNNNKSNNLKRFKKPLIVINSGDMQQQPIKADSIKTNGYNNKSYSQTAAAHALSRSQRAKQIKFIDEQGHAEHHQQQEQQSTSVLHPTGYSYETGESDIWSKMLIIISYVFLVISFPFSLCACIKVAQEYERAVVFRLGRIVNGGHKGPGIFFILPCVDTYLKVDLRTVTFDVPPQEILTKDSVTVSVDAVVYFRIFNAVISVVNVEDAAKSTKLLAASTLRNVLGTKSLHEILSDRETVANLIQNTLLAATSPWGVQVERVEVKDVRLPVQLQRAMATEAEAAREAKAKVIAAEGEKKASYALKEAAIVINQSPVAIQLRYLQTLTTIASERNSTIVFPIPLEFISRTLSRFQNTNNNSNSNNSNKLPKASSEVDAPTNESTIQINRKPEESSILTSST